MGNIGYGFFEIAKMLDFEIRVPKEGHYDYIIPSMGKHTGWISEVSPNQGLYLSSAWFTPIEDVAFTVDTTEHCLWIFCIDSGDFTIHQQGMSITKPNTHIYVVSNSKKKISFRFPKGEHICYTAVQIFDDYLKKVIPFLDENVVFDMNDSKKWEDYHYNTPEIMLILEQVRWSIRSYKASKISCQCKALELLTTIQRNYEQDWNPEKVRSKHVTWEDEQKLRILKKEIDQDVFTTITLEQMCKQTKMSETKLRKSFKELYGMTPNQYIHKNLMLHAMQLLGNDELSIQNIAHKLGYKSHGKFTSAFKEIHGITPSQFRKAFFL